MRARGEEASSELARNEMGSCKAFLVTFIGCLAFFGRVMAHRICTLDSEEEGKECLQLT